MQSHHTYQAAIIKEVQQLGVLVTFLPLSI